MIHITPEMGWGLIVKRDCDELYAPLRREMIETVVLALVEIVAVMLVAIAVARSVTRPVRALAQTAQEVSQGVLSARAPVIHADEVSRLAQVFNEMVRRIQEGQQLLVRQERLAALGQLTATVSHELRNPLGTIRTSLFMLRQQLRGKSLDIAPALDRMDRSISRCDAIIADLLDFTRIRPLERQPTEIDPWLAALLAEYHFPEHISLDCQLNAAATVPLDRERFRRCMINVLNNACQAINSSKGRVTVTSSFEKEDAVIRVTDTGCGIPSEQLEKIFEPLFSTKSFGVGLGLPIIRQIVDGHGGRVNVQSEPGQGTTFTLWLPARCEPGEVDA